MRTSAPPAALAASAVVVFMASCAFHASGTLEGTGGAPSSTASSSSSTGASSSTSASSSTGTSASSSSSTSSSTTSASSSSTTSASSSSTTSASSSSTTSASSSSTSASSGGPTLEYPGGDPSSLLVALDAKDLFPNVFSWSNKGTLGGAFAAVGLPLYNAFPPVSAHFDGNCGYIGPVSTVALEAAAPRSIEVWVNDPSPTQEEALVSWSMRNTGNGKMMSFNFGTNGSWGAATHWSPAFDVPWTPPPDGNVWTHLAYTYDGTNVTVYVNGAQNNRVTRALDTTPGKTINIAMQRAADGGDISKFDKRAALDIAVVRVFAGVLTDVQVTANFDLEKARFGL